MPGQQGQSQTQMESRLVTSTGPKATTESNAKLICLFKVTVNNIAGEKCQQIQNRLLFIKNGGEQQISLTLKAVQQEEENLSFIAIICIIACNNFMSGRRQYCY